MATGFHEGNKWLRAIFQLREQVMSEGAKPLDRAFMTYLKGAQDVVITLLELDRKDDARNLANYLLGCETTFRLVSSNEDALNTALEMSHKESYRALNGPMKDAL